MSNDISGEVFLLPEHRSGGRPVAAGTGGNR